MLFKSVVLALRQLRKNPLTSLFHIAGLAVGISAFALLFVYLQNENNYDRHNLNVEELYRVVNRYRIEKDENTTAWIAPALVTNIEEGLPQVAEAVRLFRYRSPVVMVDRTTHKSFSEPNSIWADANVFRVFTFDFILGKPDKALSRPRTMVITASTARKYFGDANPIGKVLSDITMGADFEVTAVVRDIPGNAHFKADFLCALSTLPALWGADILNSWGNSFLYTYFRLKPAAVAAEVERQINTIAANHIPGTSQISSHFTLQPVTSIHLYSNILNEWQPNSDIRYIYILTAVAVLILVVSAINYVNLWIARSEQRTREIGIRQAIGGSKLNLTIQFTAESLTHVLFGLFISVVLVSVSAPMIHEVMGEEMTVLTPVGVTWLWISVGVLLFMLMVMLYPSRIISRIRPALAIKGKQAGTRRGIILWEGLITFQIIVTTCLITGTLLIGRQISFIRGQPLGYDVSHLINIAQLSNSTLRDRLKDEFMRNDNIKAVAGVSHLVGGTLYQSGYDIYHNGKKETFLWQRIHTDHDFCHTYQIPLVAGRDFSKDVASDMNNFIINEAAARQLGLQHPGEALGVEINAGTDANGKIVGVMKDFHFKTLHSGIEPLIIHMVPDRIRMLTVNVTGNDAAATLRWMEDKWKALQPDEPFVYTSLAGFNAANYRFEEKFGKVIIFFTLIVFTLSIFGLVSLNLYIAALRRKEIGIRKVLGATTGSLLLDLSGKFARIALLAFVLSVPISFYVLRAWLNGFAYRVDLTWSLFAFGGLITFMVSMIAIVLPSWKSAEDNVLTALSTDD